MRFSIEIQNEPKMFFHSLPAAEKATGLNRKNHPRRFGKRQ